MPSAIALARRSALETIAIVTERSGCQPLRLQGTADSQASRVAIDNRINHHVGFGEGQPAPTREERATGGSADFHPPIVI